MKITLRLSESLLSIYREKGGAPGEIIVIDVEEPATVAEIVELAGVNLLLAPLILLDGAACRPDAAVANDAVITLIGPLAGG